MGRLQIDSHSLNTPVGFIYIYINRYFEWWIRSKPSKVCVRIRIQVNQPISAKITLNCAHIRPLVSIDNHIVIKWGEEAILSNSCQLSAMKNTLSYRKKPTKMPQAHIVVVACNPLNCMRVFGHRGEVEIAQKMQRIKQNYKQSSKQDLPWFCIFIFPKKEKNECSSFVFSRPTTADVIGFPRSYNNPLEEESYTGLVYFVGEFSKV